MRVLVPLLAALLALSFAPAAGAGYSQCVHLGPGGISPQGPDRSYCAGYEEVGRPGLLVEAGAYDRTLDTSVGVQLGAAKLSGMLLLGHQVCIHNGLTGQSTCYLRPTTVLCPIGPLTLCP